MIVRQNPKKLVILLLALFTIKMLTAQVNNVNDYLSKVNDKVNQVNQMANSKQIIGAMNLLNETRRDFDTYLNYYFENEMRAARKENPGFNPQLNIKFSEALTASFWESKVEQAQRSVNLAEEAFAERNHQRTLDAQDEVWAYLKTVYGIGKTIKDVYENVQTLELVDAFLSAKEGVDGFIENYIEIENARLQIINTQYYETQVRGLIRRGKIMEERCWQFASYMRAYEQDVNDFYSLVQRFNQKVSSISNETVINWSSPEYSWNKQPWLNQVNAFAREFKAGSYDYKTLSQKIESLNQTAETEKNKVYQNIHNSGVSDAFQRGVKLDEEFDDFYNLSIDVLDECYVFSQNRPQQNRNTVSLTQKNYGNSDEIFGIDRNKYLNRIKKAGDRFQKGEITQFAFYENEWPKILSDYNYECDLFAGALKTKESVEQARTAWQSFSEEMLKMVNGYVNEQHVQQENTTDETVIIKKNENITQTKNTPSVNLFAGADVASKVTEEKGAQKSSIPAQTKTSSTAPANTSLKPEKVSVAVNKMPKTGASQMARIPVYKLVENDKLVFKQTGGSLLKLWARWSGRSFSEVLFNDTKEIVFSTAELMAKRPEQAMFLDFQVNQYSDVHCYLEAWVIPKGVPIPAEWNIKESGGGSNLNSNVAGANNFYDLIGKADEAFNRKYWQESQGVRSSSNPKQESLDLLRKCEPIISGENDVNQQYTFVKILAGKYAEYARRVFVYSAKSDFIQLAGGLLSKYGGQVSSFSDSQQKSSAYTIIAEGWRDLARSATWGDHSYNKMACDKESKRYYDLALREDRSNAQLQKTVEKINAPKKPVPEQVKATPAIPEKVWAEAENFRNMMVENIPVEKENGPNYAEIGSVKFDLGAINIGSGKVWIWRSGAKNWEEITENNEYVFIGDKIRTDENTTNVSFTSSADNTNLVLKSGSVVTFYDSQIYIERGDVGLFVKKRGGKFLVITPKATTGCRGTEFTVKVDKNGNTDVHLMEGVVELRNSTEISYLLPGQAARIENENEEMQIGTFNIQQHQQQFQTETISIQKTKTELFRFVSGGGKIIGGE